MKTKANLNNFLVMLVFLLATLCTAATGGTLYVPSGYSTIQVAIDAAVNGDEIVVANGTYTSPGNHDIDFKGKAIRVRSQSGAEYCVIDCQGMSRAFNFTNNEGTDSVLEGFTIKNGRATHGGGMYVYRSSPTVKDCFFKDNIAEDGGGAVYNFHSSEPTLVGCVFSGNEALGMAIYSGGGSVYNATDSPAVLTNCTFSSNTASYQGGGIYNYFSDPTVTNCIFKGNSAGSDSGGMYNFYSSPILANCLFSGNSAGNRGGAMVNFGIGSHTTVVNCTIAHNTSSGLGGGIFCNFNSSPTVTNCILWGNSDTSGTGQTAQIHEAGGSTPSVSYNCIQDTVAGDGIVYSGTGNIDADPFFADSDGRLSAGSSCIDSGDDSAVLVATDLDGNPRIVGLKVDMGAYEFQEPSQHAAAKTKQLIDKVVVMNLQQGIENSLDSKLDAVSKALDDVNENNDIAAINALQAFINALEAQRGNKISEADADALIADAQQIIDLLMAD